MNNGKDVFQNNQSIKQKSMNIIYPEGIFSNLFNQIPNYIRITFLSSCIFGFLVHMYMFTNKLPNHDDIGHLFGSTYGEASGRWLLPYILKLDSSFSMPWVIGTASVILLAVSACLIVYTMRIRRTLGCVLTSAIVITFPTVVATFSYMFSADAYFLSLALACFAAYITNKYRFGFLGGILAITLSLGIYQSYFEVTILLMVAILIFDTLDGDLRVNQIILKGLKFIATLVIGMVIYLIIVKITTMHIQLVDYMGISKMGKISISQLPELIYKAYKEYYLFYIINSSSVHFTFMKYAYSVTAIATICLSVFIIKKKKLNWENVVLFIILFILFLLAGNFIYVMVPNSSIHLLMVYGMIGALLAPLAFAEYFMELQITIHDKTKKWQSFICILSCWIIVLTMAITSYGYALITNKAYMKMELSYEQAYSYSNRLLSTIENTNGYDVNMPIVLVGNALDGITYEPTPELAQIDMVGVMDMKELVNSYTYGYFLRRFVGASNIVYDTTTKISEKYKKYNNVENMPSYPSYNSVQIINNCLVVKLGDY